MKRMKVLKTGTECLLLILLIESISFITYQHMTGHLPWCILIMYSPLFDDVSAKTANATIKIGRHNVHLGMTQRTMVRFVREYLESVICIQRWSEIPTHLTSVGYASHQSHAVKRFSCERFVREVGSSSIWRPCSARSFCPFLKTCKCNRLDERHIEPFYCSASYNISSLV